MFLAEEGQDDRHSVSMCVSTEADMIKNSSRRSRIKVPTCGKPGDGKGNAEVRKHVSRALMLSSDQSVRIDMKLDADTHKGTLICAHGWEVIEHY